MLFESRWIPDPARLRTVLREEAATGDWTEVGMGSLEPTLGWLERLCRSHPDRLPMVADALVDLALQDEEGARAVATLLATGRMPAMVGVAQFLAAQLPSGEARDTLQQKMRRIVQGVPADQGAVAVVVDSAGPAVVWLNGPTDLSAAIEQALAAPHLLPVQPLAWLAHLAPVVPWVGAALASALAPLWQGPATHRAAAAAVAVACPTLVAPP
jgi:hypothetical protein